LKVRNINFTQTSVFYQRQRANFIYRKGFNVKGKCTKELAIKWNINFNEDLKAGRNRILKQKDPIHQELN